MKDDRLISLNAAIDALEKIDCSDGVGISSLKCDAVDDAVTAIKALQSAQPDVPDTNVGDMISRQAAIEQGVDNYGAEYKRTPNDFSFGLLTQDNCVCNICHGTGAKWKFRYVTRNYQSSRTKRICKTLQAHEHSFWICPKCLQNFIWLTGVQVTVPERRTDEHTD